MSGRSLYSRLSIGIVALLHLGLATTAHAGNQYSFFLGNLAAISGGAVTVVGDDGASLWYNPAGLVALDRDTLDLSGSAYTLRLRDYPRILRGDLPERPDEADPVLDLDSSGMLTVPSAVAFVRRLSSDVSLGFGLFVPLLDSYSARSELALREPDAHLDASVELGGETTVYTAAVGVGWRANPRFRLGATLGLHYQTVELTQMLLFAYDAPGEDDMRKGNGAVIQEQSTDRFGMSAIVGAQWRVSDEWGLGLVVRSPVIQLYQSFEQRRFQLDADVALDGTPAIVSVFAPLRRSGFDASVYLNFSTTLALAWTPCERGFLSLELDVQPGSEDDGIERELVWNMRLGGVLPLSDTVELGAGVFTDRSWEPEPREAWIDRIDYYGVAAGVYLQTPLTVADPSGRSSLVFTSTFGLRYAIGFGETLRAVADATGVHTDPSLTTIDLTFHELSLHVGSGLRF